MQASTPAVDGDVLMKQMMEAAGMAPFAEFETVRLKLELKGCSIDLDVASFGLSIMEVELMCTHAEQVAEAEERIERVAALLQARPLDKAKGGKLETYIREYCPNVLANLIDAGILQG